MEWPVSDLTAKERVELDKLRKSAISLLSIAQAKINNSRYNDKLRVAQSFCLYLHDTIQALSTLVSTPYMTQGGAIARAGIESCISGAYLLISPIEVLERYIAFSAFSEERNVDRYLELAPEMAVAAKAQIATLRIHADRARRRFNFNHGNTSGIEKSSIEQAKALDEYSLGKNLPSEWRKLVRLGLMPVQAFAHASADATLTEFDQLRNRGQRTFGHERGHYLQALMFANKLFQHVMFHKVPEAALLTCVRSGTSWTRLNRMGRYVS